MKEKKSFINKVVSGIKNSGVAIDSVLRIGVAVSGGADSVSLLLSLVEIFGSEKVFAVTVNHNIRPREETKGDADFVVELCRELEVSCSVVELRRGEVEKTASLRDGGIEEAARFLRYSAFIRFIEEKNIDYLCLAHNQNDQIETSIMRFLQGSGCDGGEGIKIRRGKFIRPLLNISRLEIEEFLNEKNQSWRTDSTNFDVNYLRNKIRNIVLPFLDSLFDGWRKSVLSGTEKNGDDDAFIEEVASDFFSNVKTGSDFLCISREKFDSLHNAVKRRVIHKMISSLSVSSRFPYKLIREIFNWNDGKNHKLNFEKLEIVADSSDFIVRVHKENLLDSGFYCVRCGFIFRSYQSGDFISMKDGRMKDVSKILSEWKVSKENRSKITIVQDVESLNIAAVLGKKLGYSDWIVDGFSFDFSTVDI